MSIAEVKKAPNHVAIIPDGNRRWARARGLKPWVGHQKGIDRFREIAEAAFEGGCNYVTFWAASVDNLKKRTRIEIRFLLFYLRQELQKKEILKQCQREKIRIRVMGEWKKAVADHKLERAIREHEEKTATFAGRELTILFGYDGKAEMLAAMEALYHSQAEKLDYQRVKDFLWTGHLPPVDLVIRTGGEPHWSSGFMMWLTADSQFYFTERLWPDFNRRALESALADYARRERRFGQ